MKKSYPSFKSFYPDYLVEHSHPVCRGLHATGSLAVLLGLVVLVLLQAWVWLLILPAVGYGFAWAGHFFFEKNRPATFRHPWYSFLGDWVMLFQLITGKLPWKSPTRNP